MDLYLRFLYVVVINIAVSLKDAQIFNQEIIPTKIDAFEQSNISYKCVHSGTKNRISWQRVGIDNTICAFGVSHCKMLSQLRNRTTCTCEKYSEGNENKTSVTLNVSRISSADHNTSWGCNVTDKHHSLQQRAFLFVKVPVKKLTIRPVEKYIQITENDSLVFTCKTSDCRPIPVIRWILKDQRHLNFTGKQLNNTNSIGLSSANSTFSYRLNRDYNGWKLYCQVTASEVQKEEINSSSITLNVTYPPDSMLLINDFLSNGNYYVIDGKTGTLTCKITGGNPKPFLIWDNCFVHESSARLSYSDEIHTNRLTWNAKSHTDRNCSCHSVQKERNDSLSIHVKVLYPPSEPILKYGSLTVSGIINVLLDETFVLDCDSDSKPPPSYQWITKNGQTLVNKKLQIEKTEKMDQGFYTCNVMNEMNATDALEAGYNNITIKLLVLYPPSVDELKDQTLIEGSSFNISCPVSHGNPNKTEIRWVSEGKTISSSQYLTINNISRNDEMIYSCYAYNIMTPTGKSPVNGTDSDKFYLSVEYSATIRNFFVNGYDSKTNVRVNESELVTFICYIDSKPISTTSLKFRTGDTMVRTNANILNYTLGPAKCTNTGDYFCYGKNEHNMGVASTEQLNLFVKCSPRGNPQLPYKVNKTSALNVSAVLHFPIIANPTPDTLVLQKYNISNWTDILCNYTITTTRIKYNISLTINIISEKDLGQYRLIVTNDVGSHSQEFYISAEDKPQSPMGFRVLKNLTTATTATVQWVPSFNGGKPQQFILNYSKSPQNNWLSEIINDTGDPMMTYTINRLSSGSLYYIILHSRNSIGSSELSEPLEIYTKVKPVKGENDVIGIVVGSVCGVIGAMVVGTVVILVFKKRRNVKAPDKMIYQNVPSIGKHKMSKQTKRTLIRETRFFEEDLQEVDDVPHIQYERTEYNNSPEKIKEIDTIRVSELFQYVLGQTEDDFAIEYQQIPTELQSSIAFARKPENIALNRYNGIFPYDHSRVKIPAIPDFFMNACYIDGYKRRNAYIASLGPTEKTTNNFITFWQMVWYEKSELIVMLTNLREPSGMKCEQYWPESGTTMTYGEMCVSSVKTAIFSEFTVKRFLLSKGKDQRPITHLHFTAWPDKTVPEDTTTLIEFRHQMKTTATSTSGPIIVHCSAGIGRTGTLIAFDRLVEEGQDKHDVNIFECVKSMRKQRVKMVQTLEQYIYIYKALVGTLCFESSYMTVKELRSLVETPKHMYSKEYQQLKQTVDTVKRDEKDALKSNENQTSKNRPGADIPGNRFRVFLNLNREHEDSDYINAVYINSFVKKEFFILAQTPLPGSTEDFICLIYQEDCTCVVSMNDQKDSNQKIGKYLPDGDKILKIGNFKVSCSVLETKHHYTLKKMKICYEGRYERGEKIVYHFQYTQWLAEMEIPDNNVDFVQFVKDVQQYACELGDERSHVLAHCLKANERSGLFCAVQIILEKLDKESQVNISNTIRHLRTRRRSAITSMEQLQFCYQAASLYAKQLSN